MFGFNLTNFNKMAKLFVIFVFYFQSQQFQQMKDLDSSILSNTQLNNSSSKMKYSFPKTARFDNKRYDCSPDKFYDLPEIKSKRSAAMGFGNKVDLGKKNFVAPDPTQYNLGSSFDLKKSKGISIGQGRDKIIAGNMFRTNSKVPSPFEYNPEKPQKSLSYSLSARIQDVSNKWAKMVPGPGNYQYLQVTKKDAKIPVSKFTSAPSAKFGHDKRLSQAQIKNVNTPGPTKYNNQSLISKRFSFKRGWKFSHSKRKDLADDKKTPGPGQYNRASDFS